MKSSWHALIASRHDRIHNQGLWRKRKIVSSAQAVDIRVGDTSLINFSSNDYLGFANNPVLKNAAVKACKQYGVGSGASHLVCGHLDLHHKLEEKLACFVGAQRAILFSNGYMANLALVSAFLSKGDLLLQDKLNHASLIDAAKLTAATAKRYAHGDLAHAESILSTSEHKGCLMATDSVFSMNGDLAPLERLYSLARTYQTLLVVDEAHGFGVFGDGGRGVLNRAGVPLSGDTLMMGTLGKALGCYGAFVAGDALYIEHLIQSARPYIYTTALPPSVAASALCGLRLLCEQGSELQRKLFSNIDYFRRSASELELPLYSSISPIQPLLLGDALKAVGLSQALFESGINVAAIRPPTVPNGTARLRIALSAAHSYGQIDQLLESISKHLRGRGV